MSDTGHQSGDNAQIIARLHASIDELDAGAWDALLALQSSPTPFLQHAYLRAMEESASACRQTGWLPAHVSLQRGRTLLAVCPMYLKSHSRGEYVFDHAWAQAWQAHGLPYYPKALVASPFTPVPGSRLLARDSAARLQLAQALPEIWQQQGLESGHLLFVSEDDARACSAAGMLLRQGLQFHWSNRHPQTGLRFESFEQFLESMQRDKRRKIRQEIRKVAQAGVSYRHVCGSAIGTDEWDFFRRCYETTYYEHGNPPYLNAAFWQHMREHFSRHWLMVLACRNGQPIACSLIGLQPGDTQAARDGVAYGRYWGAIERVDQLHFDICYYQPLAWCIANGYARFEGGAQGEHKLSRALLPQTTRSAHWIGNAHFRQAVARFLSHEAEANQALAEQLLLHSPFKPDSGAQTPQQ